MKRVGILLALSLSLGIFGGCKKDKELGEVGVYMPDGAPSLAFAKLMSEDSEDDGVFYRVVNPALIQTKVTNENESENADFCVLPVTASSKLLGSGEKYKLLATVTHGNLFMVSKMQAPTFTQENLHLLKGKTVGVLQIKQVPGLTFKSILKSADIPYQELTGGVEKSAEKVTLKGISSASEISVVDADCFILAQPAVGAVSSKGFYVVGDLQVLYGADAQGNLGYPQAVLVAKSSFLDEHDAWAKDFLKKVRESVAWANTASAETLVSAVSSHLEDSGYQTTLKAPLLTPTAIAGCSLRYAPASVCKEQINAYLLGLKGVDEQAVSTLSENFFWE